MAFRYDPNTLWPTSLADWLVLLMFIGLLLVLFAPWPAEWFLIGPGH